MVTALAVAALVVVLSYWATAPPAMVAAVAAWLVVAYQATAPPATVAYTWTGRGFYRARAGPVMSGTLTRGGHVRAVAGHTGGIAARYRGPP